MPPAEPTTDATPNADTDEPKKHIWRYPPAPTTDKEKFRLHYGTRTRIQKKNTGGRKFKASSISFDLYS